MPFFRPSTLKTEKFFQKKLRVGYVYIEESFDTIFNMGLGSGKSAMAERVIKPTSKLQTLCYR